MKMKKHWVERSMGFRLRNLLLPLISAVFLLFFVAKPVPARAQTPSCDSDSDCTLGEKCIVGNNNEGTCHVVECDTAQDCPNVGNSCITIVCDFPRNDDAGSFICIENRIEGAACAFNADCGR